MDESCYAGGRPRVLTEQCSTCIGRPGNLMHLQAGRVKTMVNAGLEEGSQGIICHQTLSYGEHDTGGALCRWFYDTYGPQNNFIRCIERIGGFTEIEPPELFTRIGPVDFEPVYGAYLMPELHQIICFTSVSSTEPVVPRYTPSHTLLFSTVPVAKGRT